MGEDFGEERPELVSAHCYQQTVCQTAQLEVPPASAVTGGERTPFEKVLVFCRTRCIAYAGHEDTCCMVRLGHSNTIAFSNLGANQLLTLYKVEIHGPIAVQLLEVSCSAPTIEWSTTSNCLQPAFQVVAQ
jgi:hypothetical protein